MNRAGAGIVLACCILLLLPRSAYCAAGQNNEGFNVGYSVLDVPYEAGGAAKTLTLAVWYPATAAPSRLVYGVNVSGMVAVDAEPRRAGGPYPLLVFSHGYGGSGLSSVFFTEWLASRGWIVVAPDHGDRDFAVRIRTGKNEQLDRRSLLKHAQEIAKSGPEDRGKYLYRVDELEAALDGALGSRFGSLIDRGRIAVGGHSLGGFTALGLCGTIGDRRDDRVKAVLLFSTGAGGYLYRESELARVKVPSLLFLGQRELDQKRGKRTMEELAETIYANLAPPKYLLVLKGGNHFSFNNRFTAAWGTEFLGGSEKQFAVIRRYAAAFLDTYVAGTGDGGVLEQQDRLLTRYQRELPGR